MLKTKTTYQRKNNWLPKNGYEPDSLNKILKEFYATVGTKFGEDYDRDSFLFMVTAANRCLTEKE